MERIQNKKILYYLLVFSFFVHISITWVQIDKTSLFNLKPDEAQPIKIKLLTNTNAKQIVQSEKSVDKTKNNSKYLSDKNNTFARETKAAMNGKFKAAGKGVRTAAATRNVQNTVQKKKKQIKNLKFSDLAFKKRTAKEIQKNNKKATQNLTRKGLKTGTNKTAGLGRTNDFLEDIPLGDFTRLNTQEYEFYGFYHRIRQKLEQFWGLNIKDKAEKLYKEGRTIASDTNLITGLTIKLDHRGKIVDIVLKSTSGVKELDDAAIESFNQAGPFPNPPKGMLKDDGKATIDWGFVVNT